jgi:hypothetical protein
MTDSDSQHTDAAPEAASNDAEGHAHGERISKGLRDQIAALRRQVKDAQDTLRDHERRREGRSFKG